MTKLLQRVYADCHHLHAQDIAEYTVMIAVVLLLVIGAAKFNGAPYSAKATSTPPAASQTK
jgi:hypothetical protein